MKASSSYRCVQIPLPDLLVFIILLFVGIQIDGTLGIVNNMMMNNSRSKSFIRIPQNIWRQAAYEHQERIRTLLQPGLTSIDDPINASVKKQRLRSSQPDDWVTPLDVKHPVYNFLIEYYGLKGAKGPRRLGRWSPSPSLVLLQDDSAQEITSIEHFQELSSMYCMDDDVTATTIDKNTHQRAILLEGATEDDFCGTLHLKGAALLEDMSGVTYSPSHFFGKNDVERNIKSASSFLWYKSVLEQTVSEEPILHCYGLHEWAMQYQPNGAPPPPSAKYQKHLPLRVDRQIINETVERKGVSCTHVDALRFFAKPALPLNHFGGPLERSDQIRLENPACVHAHMDLLKIILKLQPFCDPQLLQRVLEVSLEARKLDVAASPYDANTQYNVGVIPIETREGRAEYRKRQLQLMKEVQPVRQDVLNSYHMFLSLAFSDDIIQLGYNNMPQKQL